MRPMYEYILVFSKNKSFTFYIDRIRDYENLKKWWIKHKQVDWFVKTILYYFLDALLNEQHETKSVTEGVRRTNGVTLFANSQTTPHCLFFLSKNNSFWHYFPLYPPSPKCTSIGVLYPND